MAAYTTGVIYRTNMANAVSGAMTVPPGVTPAMVGLLLFATGQSAAYTVAPTGSAGGTFTQLFASQAGNDYVIGYEITGVTAGDTVIPNGNQTFGFDATLTFFDDITALGTVGAVGVRSSSTSSCTSGSLTPAAGRDVLVVSVERTVATGTTVSSVATSGGETVSTVMYGETASPLVNSLYIGRFTPSVAAARTTTVTYNSGSANGLVVEIEAVPVAVPQTGTLTASGSGASTFGGSTSAAGALTQTGNGGLALASADTPTGALTATGNGAASFAGTPRPAGLLALAGTGLVAFTASGLAVGGSLTRTAAGAAGFGAQTPVLRWLARAEPQCAHRGGSDDWVEETADAYAHAAAWNGELALEFSTWRTADGYWVGTHDATADRIFGTSGYTFSAHNYVGDADQLRTTTGGFPLMLLTDFLNTYGKGNQVLFVDNKGTTNLAEFFDLLDAHGGPQHIVVKGYCTASAAYTTEAANRGYRRWGYYYQADVATNLPATAARWDILGMDYGADQPSWNAALAYAKPILGHIVNSLTAATTARAKGSTGLMVSKVSAVVSHDGVGALAPAGLGTTTFGSTATAGGALAAGGGGTLALAGAGSSPGTGTLAVLGSGVTTLGGTPKASGVLTVLGAGAGVLPGQPRAPGSLAAAGYGQLALIGAAGQPAPGVRDVRISLGTPGWRTKVTLGSPRWESA